MLQISCAGCSGLFPVYLAQSTAKICDFAKNH